MSSIADSGKKRGRPRTGIGEAIGLRLYPDLSAALDAWIASQPEPQPSRPEAIRRLVEKGLETSHASDASLDRQIAGQEETISRMPESAERSSAAALATMDKALAKNELIKMKNAKARRKSPKQS